MNKNLLNILVCPVCKGKLDYQKKQEELICLFDRLAYLVRKDIPVMLEQEARHISLEEYDQLKK